MKKFLPVIIVGGLLLTMAFTCPKYDSHIDAISESFSQKSIILKLVGKEYIKVAIDKIVNVKDYVFVSVGTYLMNDENNIVSIGVFGHLFTFMKGDIIEEVSRAVGLSRTERIIEGMDYDTKRI